MSRLTSRSTVGTRLSNVTLIALAASYFTQIGAGVFALTVIGRVVRAAPPRSLAMLQGQYRYDSSAFWQVVPAITGVLFLLAIAANWKTRRRGLMLGALALFAISGVTTVVFVQALFAEVVASGYRDAVDPALQALAARWYAWDWGIRCIDAAAGLALLVALTRTVGDSAPEHQ